jgi:polyisoprenoid-binding protein YceI
MKKIVLNLTLMLAVAAAFVGCNNAAENAENTSTDSTAVETSYTVDPAGSQVMWRGDMVKMYFHEGSVAVKEGTFTTKGGLLSTGSIVIDMNTITPLDSGYDNKDRTKEKLVGHLTSPDFFDIANNPTASFEIKSVNGAEATGILTIRGKSNEETIKNIVITETAEGSTVAGDLTFDRKKYDVAFDMTVKDMVLSNDIALKITLTGKK